MSKRTIFALMLGAGMQTVSALEYRVECPAELSAQAVKIVEAPTGWTPFTPSFFRLQSVGIMYAEPSKKEQSVPSSEQRRKNTEIIKWTMEPTHEMWLECGYGFASEVTLSKQLQKNTSECTATYTKTEAHGPANIDMRCKLGK